jgi:hypothetical protein
MFHGNQGDNSIEAIQSEIQRKLDLCGKTIDDLLRDWVAVIYANLFQKDANGQFKIRNPRNSNGNQIVDLEVVVAVPPGRSVIAHEQVLQAFIQGPIRAHQVSLVSEPEA